MIRGMRTRVLLTIGSVAAIAAVTGAPATAAPSADATYVALGDSYSSLPAEATVGATDQERACGRSTRNYPKLVAAALALPPSALRDNTCGGARTRDAFGMQRAGSAQTGYSTAAPQLTGIGPSTHLVTVSLGGNDDDLYGGIAAACVAVPRRQTVPCTGDERSRPAQLSDAAVRNTLARVTEANERIVRAVRTRSPRARLLLIGYPKVFLPHTVCAQIAAYDPASLPWISSILTTELNAAVRRAAVATKAEFVDVAPASAGDELCSKDPWINGTRETAHAQALHPFPAEGVAVAQLIEQHLRTRR